MKFRFSSEGLHGREQALQRFLEILPGATSWSILIGMTLLSFWKPLWAAVIIMAFDLYWLVRVFYMTFFLVLSYSLLRLESQTDWIKLARTLDDPEHYLEELKPPRGQRNFKQEIVLRRRRKEYLALIDSGESIPLFENIQHLVIIPIVREARPVIEPGIRGLCEQKFPSKNIFVVLAVEERASDTVKEGAEQLMETYKHRFLDFWVVKHPDGLPGEARVKGANATYAAQQAARYFRRNGIDFRNIIVSCFDADTVVSPEYFACLTYHFMVCPYRTRASFQPIPVYHNNIWKVPAFARVLETGSSFFLLTEATNPEKLVTFSSHSMSFQALVDVDFWPVDIISDDSGIFWKSFIHFDGDYHVVPMYVTLSMDIAQAFTWWKTVQSIYRQKRRWAWGVENFPLVVRAFFESRTISLYDRIRHGFKLFEGHVAWATWAFLLSFISWIPAFLSSKEFSSTVLYFSSPRIVGTIFNLSLLAFLTSIGLSLYLLPKKDTRSSFLRRAVFALEWLCVPFVIVFLSALPALDTQTRLLFRKRLTFWVTEKPSLPIKKI